MRVLRVLGRGRLAGALGLVLAAALLAAALAGGCVDRGGAPAVEAAQVLPTETPADDVLSTTPSDPTATDTDEITPAAGPRVASRTDLFGRGTGEATVVSGGVPTVEELLEKGLYLAEASPAHLAIRGTASGDTVRCEWRGIARTTEQRENAIRFWLGLDADDAIPDAAYLEILFRVTLETVEAAYLETAISNFMAIAKGGLSTEYLFLTCYADYATTEYLLGAGPATLTAAYDRMGEARSYELYRREHEAGQFGSDALQTRGEYEAGMRAIVAAAEESLIERIGGRESVAFLAPMGDHNAIAIEAWLAVGQWFLETVDGTVNAVREGAEEDDPEHTQTLAGLKTRVTAGAAADGETRIANASGLQAHYRSEGAYGDIAPGDGETTTFTPAQPMAAPTCTNGTVIASPNEKRELVRDCELLLGAKSTLAGTATLNWSAATAIASWDGITTGGDPLRVTQIDLASESLTGTIPAALGRLYELTVLKLNGNSLTGSIPAELGWLYKLTELRLTGNSLTGCIPLGLKDVATNDLSTLNLLYCEPPAPGSVTVGTVLPASVALSWGAVSDASKYRVEYRVDGRSEWVSDDETLTGTTHTVDGLSCGTAYQFRVSAYGGGTTYAAAWGEGSAVVAATTGECVPPAFGAESYSFTIAQNAAAGTALGTVSATDTSGGTVTYTITAGNTGEAFSIGADSGEITLAGALDRATTPAYALTVEAASGNGGAATVAVAIAVSAADYDLDDDGLIEITTLAQLHALRWDLDGDGSSTEAGYAAAYPGAAAGMGCPADGCEGYELTGDLDFDTDASGSADAGDDYWNGGSGWEPIGTSSAAGEAYDATFEGNGHVIANLHIDRDDTSYVGLFGATATSGVVRNVGLPGMDVTGNSVVGGLVGWNQGRIATSYASGSVTTDDSTLGGLVGWNAGTVVASHADVSVAGGIHAGGLAGGNGSSGVIDASYASGSVSGSSTLGGLVGFNSGQLRRSYARGGVTASSTESAYVGGLGGRNTNIVATSYWDTQTSGQAASAGGAGKTTSQLRTPTGYTGIYADWDAGGAGADAWDFGTASQYPVLKVDFNGDGRATWWEFGDQRPGVNRPPIFAERAPATRSVDENTAAGEAIGAPLTATDADADTLTYSLSGADAADFAIDAATGQLRTSAALDHETTTSHAVTVGVSDGNGGSASIAVTIEVVDMADLLPGAPANLTAGTPGERGVELSWDAVTGAGEYRVERQASGATEWTVNEDGITETTHTVRLICATTFQLRVSAYGDGITHAQQWGAASTAVTVTATACTPPVFVSAPYSFTVSEDAAIGAAVGTVRATDAGALTYAITAGNAGDVFDIGEETGEITLAGALDYATARSYELTVSATDENGATATAMATVAVTSVTDYDVDNDGLIEIASLAQLHAMRWDPDGDGVATNAGYATAYPNASATMGCPVSGCEGYELAADLDFDTDASGAADFGDTYWNGGSGWQPIGSASSKYEAVFEGNGRTIANLYIDRATSDKGLFGVTGTASEIRNVGLVGVDVTGDDRIGGLVGNGGGAVTGSYASGAVVGDKQAGGLVGQNSGPITASRAAVTVAGDDDLGGLVGLNSGAISGSHATGNVTSTGSSGSFERLGGLVGKNSGPITDSHATGSVTKTSGSPHKRLGGLVGENSGPITDSYATGVVASTSTSSDNDYVGGLIGWNSGTIKRSHASGEVTGYKRTGGLIGHNQGAIDASYASGSVTGRDYVGGLVGWNAAAIAASYATGAIAADDEVGGLIGRNSGAITAGYARGDVTGAGSSSSHERLGGLVGQNSGPITASYATGRVSSGDQLGGLLGRNSGTITNSYWDTETSGRTTSSGGTGKTTSELQTPTGYTGIYAGWNVDLDGDGDPDDPWAFGGSSQYPVLKVDYDGDGVATWEEFGDQRAGENRAPAFDEGATTTRAVAENTAAGEDIGAAVSATDADADTLAYSLSGTDAADFAIDTGTGQLRTSGALDYETQASYAVTVEVSDGNGGSDSIEVTIEVLNAADTAPGAPQNVAATPAQASVALSWDAVTGAGKYRVERREDGAADWTTDDETLAATTHVVDELTCATTYEFRVSAYGDGAAHTEVWGEASTTLTADTSACPGPEFGEESYEFSVRDDAGAGTSVGTVEATTNSDEAIVYALTAGNSGDVFGIGESTGEITLAGTLDAETTASYELTVRATAGHRSSDVTVTITVEAAPTTAPAAPQNVVAGTITQTSVELGWDAVAGASKYDVEYLESGGESWTSDDAGITGTTHTLDELTCATTYQFRVSAYGDGIAHTEAWGDASTPLTAGTAACPALEFREESYSFTVAAGAGAGTSVGTVLATTTTDDAITYAIQAGNSGDVFGIGEATGEITLAGTLGAGPYQLTVRATAGTASADVTVTVTVAAAAPLTAEFPASRFSSGSHSGADDRPQVIVTFSRAVSSFTASTPSVSVTGGSVSSVRAHEEEGLEHAWIFFLDPDGNDAVEFSLVTGQACDAGGICAADGTQLSVAPAARTIPGPAVTENSEATGAPTIDGTPRVYETLTADVSGIADADRLTNVSYTYQWIAGGSDIAGATGSSYALTTDEEGQTIQVRVSFSDDAGNGEALTSVATAAVAAATPLTASFENVPETHNGSDDFTFELRFSEEFAVGFATLRDDAFEETNGAVAKAQRLTPGSNIGWRITVTPDGNADVTVVLPATSDCGADGAICTAVGKPLSNRSEITVPGPSE